MYLVLYPYFTIFLYGYQVIYKNFQLPNLTKKFVDKCINYIKRRKPDIVGHYDVITKFDEIDVERFLNNNEYLKIADKYMNEAVKNDVIFEVNTGAISRGYRKKPYPHENLMYILKKNNAKLILGSDSHSVENLVFGFDEARKQLKDIGFQYVYILSDGEFKKDYL